MSLDLLDMSDIDFEEWLREASSSAPRSDLSEERLVELVNTTLREDLPEARARSFVDLANLCYAMADKTLGSLTLPSKCFKVVVNVKQGH